MAKLFNPSSVFPSATWDSADHSLQGTTETDRGQEGLSAMAVAEQAVAANHHYSF